MTRDDEFADYVSARWTTLVRSLVLLGCPPHDAEDVVQAALVKCLKHWAKVQRADHRDAYVHRVVVNTWYSSRRRRWNGERPTEEIPDAGVSDFTHEVDAADVVLRSLARLSEDQRAVVVLRHYANLGEAEMAQVLGVPVGTVKSRLSRALKVLAADPHLNDLEGVS